MLKSKTFRQVLVVLLVLLNIGCDQISKEVVRTKVAPQDYIQLIENNFILTNVENTGAMLGFGQNFSPTLKLILLQGIPLLVLLILLYRTLVKIKQNKWLAYAFAFVIGGGIGNLLDRILHGSVTDFLFVKIGFFKTGIFNMADVSVTLGAIFILLYSFYSKKLSI